MNPGHVAEDDDRRMLDAERLRFVRDRGPVPIEVGGNREGEPVAVFGGRAEATDDRDAGRGQRSDLIVLAKRRCEADDSEHVLSDQIAGALAGGARVVLRVAPDVFDLAAVDAARLVDRLHVGADGVAFDRRVDWPGDVEEAADGDLAAGHPAGAPTRLGRCAARSSWHGRGAGAGLGARHLALLHQRG